LDEDEDKPHAEVWEWDLEKITYMEVTTVTELRRTDPLGWKKVVESGLRY